MRLNFDAPTKPFEDLALRVGDEVVVIARGIVTNVGLELVDVTGFQADELPDLIPGDVTATVTLVRTRTIPQDAGAADVVTALRELGVDL